ncbi:V-type ATP synthase subunit E [Yanshouia hominis]|uniref:V-type proton ATPase subunit E n=1 Tax=Yanshouia hominis TaxID=2763673 RepID=A0ABR7NJ45_9FIRM|nr:V-type ATP synthase subunit E [Yanshouia hominis]MBC8576437.1 hypothetical protein [Yanshouia hominis]
MNGLDNISNKILSEAAEQAKEILADAERQAAEIAEKSEADAARELAEGRRAIEARRADLAEKARLAASLEHRRLLATTRQELIGQAFSTALDRLIHLPAEEYRRLLILLAEQALADGEGGELLFNERDRAAHGDAVVSAINAKLVSGKVSQVTGSVQGVMETVRRGGLPTIDSLKQSVKSAAEGLSQGRLGLVTLAEDCAPIPGGVVVRRGKIELNCALDVSVRMLAESMAFEVSALLFPEGA